MDGKAFKVLEGCKNPPPWQLQILSDEKDEASENLPGESCRVSK